MLVVLTDQLSHLSWSQFNDTLCLTHCFYVHAYWTSMYTQLQVQSSSFSDYWGFFSERAKATKANHVFLKDKICARSYIADLCI